MCRIEARILISLRAFYFYFDDKFAIFTLFSAYVWLSYNRITLYTVEYAPSPSFDTI